MVENLRSVVSKEGLITVREVMEQLPRPFIEQEIDAMTQVLIKKSADSNAFMADEADKTLISMCNNITEQKMFSSLSPYAGNKAAPIRAQVCKCYSAML
jgi:hypothetical protein